MHRASPGMLPLVGLPGPYKRSLLHSAVIVVTVVGIFRASGEHNSERSLRNLGVGFNPGVEVALIEAISALNGKKKIMRVQG